MIYVPLLLYLQEFVENSSKALEALKTRKYADKNQIQPQEKDGMGDSTTTIPDIAQKNILIFDMILSLRNRLYLKEIIKGSRNNLLDEKKDNCINIDKNHPLNTW